MPFSKFGKLSAVHFLKEAFFCAISLSFELLSLQYLLF
jgi:hypothetical protein